MAQGTNGGVSLGDIVGVASDAGIIGLLIAILWGGLKRWWVWGWYYDEVRRERDEWKELALSSTDLADKMAEMAERRSGRV